MLKNCKTLSCNIKIKTTKHYCDKCREKRIKESRRNAQLSKSYKEQQALNSKKPKEEPKSRLDRKSFWDYTWCNSMNGSAYDF